MNGVERIAAERLHQLTAFGDNHDDEHDRGQILHAALCYAKRAQRRQVVGEVEGTPFLWPWEPSAWKPSADPIRNLERAGALIAAEIGRQLRAWEGSS